MSERESKRVEPNDAADKGARAEQPRPVRLDLEKLDLTVEQVEDRIRPGETNVFDK